MQLFTFANLLLELITALLIILIYILIRGGRRDLQNTLFIGIVVVSLVWVVTNLIANFLIENDRAYLVWSRITIVGPALLPILLLLFSDLFPKDGRKLNYLLPTILFVPTFVLLVLVATPYNIETVANGSFTPGPLYYVLIVMIVSSLLVTYVKLAKRVSEVEEKEKQQIRLVLIGIVTALFFGLLFNAVLPLLGYGQLAVYGPIPVIFFIGATAYAMLRFQLLNIKLIITEVVVYSMVLIILIDLLVSRSAPEIGLRLVLLLAAFYAGILLINATKREIVRRKEVEKLAHQLEGANSQLEKDKEDLVELDRMKDEFLQMATHELNTPIAVIKGRLDMAINEDISHLNPEQKKLLSPVLNDTIRLARLSKDILDTARIDQKRLKLNVSETDLDKLIGTIVSGLQLKAKERNNILAYQVSTIKLPIVNVDQSKISEVVTNLLTNAIKFTTNGKIIVTTNFKDSQIIVSVADTGVGIDEQDQKHLFQKFYQAGRFDPKAPQEQQGTGLGLYISKNIINLHGGDMSVKSAKGHGSIFSFTLPTKAVAHPETQPALTANTQGVT